MRKTLATAALVLALCSPAFAGIIHTPPVVSPEPPPQEQAAEGEIQNPPLAVIVLTLLALF